jgi:hypothetical protein
VREELARETTRAAPAELVARAWERMRWRDELAPEHFEELLRAAQRARLAPARASVAGLVRELE